uniref:hypothetical protein n=1 Tax=Klebsiella michiganensis TaxID=1134687 RepID=UPI001BD43441
ATIEGTNPSLAIVDEYHLHPDNGVYSALELGMGARPEAVLFANRSEAGRHTGFAVQKGTFSQGRALAAARHNHFISSRRQID